VLDLNRIAHLNKTAPGGGVDLCMEPTDMKRFLLPNDSSHDCACGVDDRKQCACVDGHKSIDIGESTERRIYRLSDQENNH
jgi:hypothetical protein